MERMECVEGILKGLLLVLPFWLIVGIVVVVIILL
ncbi:hypothetical protein J2S00_002234 [Caldalkalibacillus uzonensis]|uniref:Uncharacterized protein n=1 Tax=Caldalkalibacillus uzonensis TaxID=353224 RepID=A0ABU0CTL9_9BACI|nr:hypothetical protein [Caldalkalibacillus uzonensis]